ncbi:MAG: hypothetical protein KKF44_06220 [Nanoarchaeota archaeon]|nr:hypothetical protein [Nanoarchaeota archaeon]
MRKNNFIRIIGFIVLCILLTSIVQAVGVAPSKSEIFFEENIEKTLSFRIINNEHKDAEFAVYMKGDLADYLSLENDRIKISASESEKSVYYRLDMPVKMKPGPIHADIYVVEMSENGPGEDNLIKANIGVMHRLTVNVPYPDEYLQGILYISDAKPDEIVDFTVSLSNVGSEDLESIKGQIIITSSDGQSVAKISTDEILLESKKKSKLTAQWNARVSPGTYHALALIEYGEKVLVIEKDFDIGEPLLEIEELRIGSFKLGTIAKFDIIARNEWNNRINDVYAVTEIQDENNVVVETYKSSTVDVPALAKKELSSYWDTNSIEPGIFVINVKLNYLGRSREKAFELDVRENKIIVRDPTLTGQVIGEIDNAGGFDPKSMIMILISIVCILSLIIIVFAAKAKFRPKLSEGNQSPGNENLMRFIKVKLQHGFSEESIRKNLMEKGWNKETVDEAILKAEEENELE